MHRIRNFLVIIIGINLNTCNGKYMEGQINTNDNWAFLARFCFLSEQGTFEYYFEFNEDIGEPNLLLYYDTDDQWPAVYKTNKTCYEKENVLHVDQNQVINLTARFKYYREMSGCVFTNSKGSTEYKTSYTVQLPTLPTKTTTKLTTKIVQETTSFVEETTTVDTISSEFNESEAMSTMKSETTTEPTVSTTKKVVKRAVPFNVRNFQGRYGRTVSCHNAKSFRSSRERWWFIALSNCKSNKGIHVKYRILMTNGPPGDYWHEHFSADEFYILPILMAFFIAYSFLFLGVVVCSMELKSRQLLHTSYKIFVVSVILQMFGILFQSVYYLKYAVNGTAPMRIKRLGNILMGASETCFLLLMLLLAKGFTVTRGRLPLAASVKLTIFMCLYVMTYISIFIYESRVFDPGEVLYLYESPAGYGLIILRVIAWCMFIYSTVFTLKHYPEKGNFYYPFNICGTLWFIAGPAFILSANTYIDKWVRESVVCAVLHFITFGGHLSFLILTMPSVANKNFPYHVRTTQIGVMETYGDDTAIEKFSHHIYEPTTAIAEQKIIVPLTRRTEEIYEGMYSQRGYSSATKRVLQENGTHLQDLPIKNNLSWCLAKNALAIELPKIEDRRASTGSVQSRGSEDAPSDASRSNYSPRRNFDDYVRDVPVELFTISRMIVTNNSLNKSK